MWHVATNYTCSNSTCHIKYADCTSEEWRLPSYPTEEETAQRLAVAAEQTKKKAEAFQRAEELLLLCLSEEQQQQYREHGYFDTVVDDRRFRINNWWSGNVYEYNPEGIKIRSYCLHPKETVPVPDHMLIQKLMLEMQLGEFIRTANVTAH